ncbi:MarC family protein [Paraburkholderia sp. UCT31]|uniref:MarC family protein n=1 Tax=Paraburkholderia sp. UCT31 TaxID=2615209 RepID=UPI001655F772|nr:MarC family protein [Paraburkholderia sp. UCT31]MBC8737022.1 MarC family protein [Paraburkholderia sp. UCT31]
MHLLQIFKKLVTLLALVDPFSMVPVFLGAVNGRLPAQKEAFARAVGVAVAVALLVTAVAGGTILQIFGISIGNMQVAGGVLVLILAVAMVLGKEEAVKQGHSPREVAPTVVPLAVPLMVGPAAISFTIGNNHWSGIEDIPALLIPPVIVGLATWFTFGAAARAGKVVNATALDLIEKVGGFLLAAMAVEMLGTGLKSMFPALGA